MRAFLLSFFTVTFFTLQAQVSGKILDSESGAALPYATVSLFSKSDSLLVDGTITDENGVFSMEVKPGSYFAKVEFLAYEPLFLGNIDVKNSAINLGTIKLSASSTTLDEVVVQAEKSSMQMSLDKKVFNVGKDLGNAGGNAADLLANIPSISVDVEGTVSLRGSNAVRILIDGKPSGLVSFNGSAGLQQLQGSMIERVEIITNPSARYEAEGVGGIINIILKKERKNGFNGSFDLIAGTPTNYGVGLNLNYRKDKLNFFINYGISYRNSPGTGSVYQRVFGGDTTFIYSQTNEREIIGFNQSIRGGLDYFFNPQNILTAAYTFRRSDANRITDLYYTDYFFDENTPISKSIRQQDEDEIEPNSEYSLAYKKTFNRKDQELNAEVRILDNWEDSDQDFTERFFNPDGSPSSVPDLFQNSYNYETEKQFLVQVDYVQPFAKEGRIEGGVRSSFRNMLNDFRVTQLNDGNWEPLPGLDNKFLYDEQIHAAYGIVGNKTGKFSYQFGLRAEHTSVTTELTKTNEINPRKYTKLFPSAHLTYDLPNQNAVQVSYSRRIRRPRYNDLSPFMTYTDNRNFWSGNPDLDPEFTNSYELTHIKYFDKGSVSSTVYYRHTIGEIDRIRRVDSLGNSFTRPENLSTEDAFGADITAIFDLAKWWKMDANFNFFRAITDGGNLGTEYQSDTYSWFTRLTSRFTFWKNTDLQLRGNYRAKQQDTQGYRKPQWFLDVGVSKDILKGNGTLTLNVSDMFNTRRHRSVSEGETFYSYNDSQWQARQINLTFSYRLHQQKKKEERKGDDGGDD